MVITCQKNPAFNSCYGGSGPEEKFCYDLISVWVTFLDVFCLIFYIFSQVLLRFLFKFRYYYYYYYYYCYYYYYFYYYYYYYYHYYYYYFIIINLFI